MQVKLHAGSITGTFWSAWQGDEWLGYLIPCSKKARAKALTRDTRSDELEWPDALAAAYKAFLDRHHIEPCQVAVQDSKLDMRAAGIWQLQSL